MNSYTGTDYEKNTSKCGENSCVKQKTTTTPTPKDKTGFKPDSLNKKITPLKAIRAKCIDCSGGSKKEVRLCWAKECPLYAFRMGKNPYQSAGRKLSKAQRKALIDRLPTKRHQ